MNSTIKSQFLSLIGNKLIVDYFRKIIIQSIDPNIEVVEFNSVLEIARYLKQYYHIVNGVILNASYKHVFDLIKAIKEDKDTNLVRIITLIETGITNDDFIKQIYMNGGHYFINLNYAQEVEIRAILENVINDSKRIKLLKKETLYDPLTMVFNRRGLINAFRNMLSYTQSMAKEQIVKISFFVSIMDIDNFKMINDTYGHRAGDLYLQNLAYTIKELKRKEDIFGRYGGEEFCMGIIAKDFDSGISVFERIREAIEQMKVVVDENKTISTTISIGVAISNINDSDVLSVIQRADQALYIAKGKGKNKVEIVD